MPDSTEPQPSPQDPAPRRKSKPKFEVPTDAGQPADAGWVYRDEALPAPVPEVAEPIAEGPPSPGPASPQPIITSAIMLFATGIGLMTRVAMTAMTLFATPVTMLRRRRAR